MFVCILLENLVYMMQYCYLLSHGVYYAPNYLLTSKIYILWQKSSHFLIPQLLSIATLCSVLWIWLCWFQIVDRTMFAFVLPFAMAWGRSTCLKFSLPQKMLTCQRTATVTTDSQHSKGWAWVTVVTSLGITEVELGRIQGLEDWEAGCEKLPDTTWLVCSWTHSCYSSLVPCP